MTLMIFHTPLVACMKNARVILISCMQIIFNQVFAEIPIWHEAGSKLDVLCLHLKNVALAFHPKRQALSGAGLINFMSTISVELGGKQEKRVLSTKRLCRILRSLNKQILKRKTCFFYIFYFTTLHNCAGYSGSPEIYTICGGNVIKIEKRSKE